MLGLHRFTGCFATQFIRRSLSGNVTAPAMAAPAGRGSKNEKAEVEPDLISAVKPKSSMVAAAFASLKNDDLTKNTELNSNASTVEINNIDERIINAKTVNGLLAITESKASFSRKHALKIVSILAEWSTLNRVNISEFENDGRFLRICRMLGRTMPKNEKNGKNVSDNNIGIKRISGFQTDDLSMVLGVAGDDEAAKLIASISLAQMVKVMTTLSQRKRRSTPLLRSLAYNISSSSEQLNLKQCADIFYAMATLNFQDSVLSAKVCADAQVALPQNTQKSAVVGSIITSLGKLKYRDLDMLESVTQWILENIEICRPQDLTALFLSSSILSFKSANSEELRNKLAKTLVEKEFAKKTDWLDYIWALSMLGLVENSQLNTVLNAEFTKQLSTERNHLSPTSKMKLQNLNSYAQLAATDYKGLLLAEDSPVFNLSILHAKSKQNLVNGMLDALKMLLPANNHVQSLVQTKMGFIIDALCYFDDQRNPLPLDTNNSNVIKVALMVVDFHDICHGPHRSVSGITNLMFDLLEKSGYKVIPVLYNEFNTSDKLLKRVQYLEGKFKTIISSKN